VKYFYRNGILDPEDLTESKKKAVSARISEE